MKDDLLPYYERELIFIRQMAAEFAANYPDRAGALKLNGEKSADPHVERLIEAFALLAGRVHHKIDDEFPEISESLLGILYPHYLRPIPSMSIAQFEVDPEQAKLSTGYTVPKHSSLYSKPVGGVACQFRTCYPVTLWPLQVVSGSIVRPSNIGLGTATSDAFAAIRIELRVTGSMNFSQFELDRLRFFLSGDDLIANTLYELIFNNAIRVILRNPSKRGHSAQVALPFPCIGEVGFGREEGMLPYSDRSFVGYRLLQEYFHFPQKFMFFDLSGFDRISKTGLEDRFEILILLSDFERKERLVLLEQAVNADTFQLGCTPIVNLFHRTAEPIRLSHTETEYRVVPDMIYPFAMEVYSVDRVIATAPYSEEPQEYQPFYSFRHTYMGDHAQTFWHSSRRPSHRKADDGTEVYLSLLDLDFRPSLPPVETLTVRVTCTNRDLPQKLPFTQQFGEFEMESSAMLRVRCLKRLTDTVRPPLRRGLQWRLVSHLGLNYLSIVEGGTDALQEILKLYDFSDDPVVARQISGITNISSKSQVARVISENGVVFCLGVHVGAEFDEEQYAGSGVFLLASVLERFFGLYSSINSFSQLTARTQQRKGFLKQWPPRAGEQILL